MREKTYSFTKRELALLVFTFIDDVPKETKELIQYHCLKIIKGGTEEEIGNMFDFVTNILDIHMKKSIQQVIQ